MTKEDFALLRESLEAIGGLKSHVDEYKSDPEQYEKDTHELSMLMGGLD